MRSKLPSAEKFENWVTSEVLPSILQTGTYSMRPEKIMARASLDHSRHRTLSMLEAEAKERQRAGGRMEMPLTTTTTWLDAVWRD